MPLCVVCGCEVKDYRRHQKTSKHAWNLIDKTTVTRKEIEEELKKLGYIKKDWRIA